MVSRKDKKLEKKNNIINDKIDLSRKEKTVTYIISIKIKTSFMTCGFESGYYQDLCSPTSIFVRINWIEQQIESSDALFSHDMISYDIRSLVHSLGVS